jgi:hypothetical protein
MEFGLDFAGRFSFGHIVHKGVNILACDRSHSEAPEQRLDMTHDPTSIRRQRTRLL